MQPLNQQEIDKISEERIKKILDLKLSGLMTDTKDDDIKY